MASLNALPAELLRIIVSFLATHDIARLVRVATRFHELLAPEIWTDLNFHDDYHTHRGQEPYPQPPACLLMHRDLSWPGINGEAARREKFFGFLDDLGHRDPQRLEILTNRVKHLCTDIFWRNRNNEIYPSPQQDHPIWRLLPLFHNLDTLYLYGDGAQRSDQTPFADIGQPPPRLRFARLWGYIPRPAVQFILRAGKTLERLELGMLDRPLSAAWAGDDKWPALSEADEEDALGCDFVLPRPLGGFLDDLTPSFPRLKHLHLLQPCDGFEGDSLLRTKWSAHAEKRCLEDWKQLLAASPALQVLILEQRIAGVDYVLESYREDRYVASFVTPTLHEPLLDALQPTIDGMQSLEKVYLYGMAVSADGDNRAYQWLRRLEGRGVACEARVGRWLMFQSHDICVMLGDLDWTYSDDEDGTDYGDENTGSQSLGKCKLLYPSSPQPMAYE